MILRRNVMVKGGKRVRMRERERRREREMANVREREGGREMVDVGEIRAKII